MVAALRAVEAQQRAAPVRVVAALNVSAPKERIGAQLDKLGRIVAGAARDLSAALGHQS